MSDRSLNSLIMKNLKKRVVFVLFAVALIPSCELLDCKDCSYVTYLNGAYESETPSIPYCGDALAEKEAESPVTVGDRITYVECY